MLSKYIGSGRTAALSRGIIGTIWLIAAGFLLAWVYFPIAVVVVLISLVYQLITGRSGFLISSTLKEPYTWMVDNVRWTFFGEGQFSPLPYM